MTPEQIKSLVALVAALVGVGGAFDWISTDLAAAICGAAALLIPVLHFKRAS